MRFCIACDSNAGIRSAAIKNLGRRLVKPNKQKNASLLGSILGDTEALLELFAQSSVADIKSLCIAISNSGRHGWKDKHLFEARQEAVERLVRALLPSAYPTEAAKGSCRDGRPLQHLYAIMLPACSAHFVESVLDARDQSNPLYRFRDSDRLLRCQRANFKRWAEEYLLGISTTTTTTMAGDYVSAFLDRDRLFARWVLQNRYDGKIKEGRIPEQQGGKYSDVWIALSLIKHMLKRHQMSKEHVAVKIRSLVQIGLELHSRKSPRKQIGLETHSRKTPRKRGAVKDGFATKLWKYALHGWRKWPEIFEPSLILGLKLGLGTSPDTVPSDYLSAVGRKGFPAERRPRLLQLYCQHVGKKGCNVFAEDADFTGLANMLWPYEVFDPLDAAQSMHILKKLEGVNQSYNFLLAPSTISSILDILEAAGKKNFNVELFKVQLQRDDPLVQQKAQDALDGLRRKAATAKEETVRADFAQAAIAYSLASGDLKVYGETVLWQQRFVRDPWTLNTITSRRCVLTEEGIDLLSALQSSQGSRTSTSSDTIRMADDILKTFYETYRLAKREPSFNPRQWQHVKSLFGAVYNKRVQGLASSGDTESKMAAMQGFLNATHWMDIEFLDQICDPVVRFLKAQTPTLLASATQDLLHIGAERRKEEDRTPEDDRLERMSYKVLKSLAQSNMPSLASDLVVQTIINRPDASSWHRQLLSEKFLNRLRTKEAHRVLISLARAVGDKLEEQSYVRVGETEPAKSAPPKSLVKVTTVKYLATLLNKADFVSNETAIEVLVELFKNAQHSDIRLAALESLLGLLDNLCTNAEAALSTNPTVELIMGALETLVPIVGSINENRPPREEDWIEAETTGALPEPHSQMGPVMRALLSAVSDIRHGGLKAMQPAFCKRLILPSLERSQAEHSRWLRLFLAKYKAPFSEEDVPRTPVAVANWDLALKSYYPLTGATLLADFNAYAMHQIVPDARLEEFTTALSADVQLLKSVDVRHWIRTYARDVYSSAHSRTATLLHVLQTKYSILSLVECESLVELVMQHADALLDHYEGQPKVWDGFMTRLSPDWADVWNVERHDRWRDTLGRIVRHISDEIGKRNTQAMHQVLPSRTKLELWLLPFLASEGDDNNAVDFVVQLESTVLRLLEDNESEIFGWSAMADDVVTISGLLKADTLKAKVANEFGKLSDSNNRDTLMDGAAGSFVREQARQAMDLIKVNVAIRLFDKCADVESIKSVRVRERLTEWRTCGSDLIRKWVFQWEGKKRFEQN